jgi:hypothetical protein
MAPADAEKAAQHPGHCVQMVGLSSLTRPLTLTFYRILPEIIFKCATKTCVGASGPVLAGTGAGGGAASLLAGWGLAQRADLHVDRGGLPRHRPRR